MELLAIWQRGFYRECFALRWELRELVWGFYRRVVCEVVLGCGVAVMEQVTRGSGCDKGRGPGVAGDDGGGGCAAKGWAAVVRCKGGMRRRW
jgi:hypothetical protein